jgi:cob(I)alamin adenosyltransferase
VQQDLFIVAAELATPTQRYPDFAQKREVVNEKMVKRLEEMIEALEEELEMPQAFIIPGACVGSAALDLARTIIRRAERRVVSLKDAGLIPNEEVLKYLNRLADLVFTLARYEEAESGR